MATLTQLSNPRVHNGGEELSVVIETVEKPPFELRFGAPEAADLIQFLCGMASAAAEARGATGLPAPGSPYYFVPMEATGIGFAVSKHPEDTTLLVLNLSGFAMPFEIPNSDLLGMADELQRVARTLSARGPSN